MSLMDSVNDNRTVNKVANNTRTAPTYRNATFSAEQLTGFTKVWQNLTLTQLQATYDARAVQGGETPYNLLSASGTITNKRLAMRFTALTRTNLTGFWMYYSLTGSSIPFTILNTTSNSGTPNGPQVGSGSIPVSPGGLPGWYYIQLNTNITLTKGNHYWLTADASALNPGTFSWYYLLDGLVKDNSSALYRGTIWYDEFNIKENGWVEDYFNFMLVVKVLEVGNDNKVRSYSSPQDVKMSLNSTTGNWITANSTRISNAYNTFVICTNTSVTFTARWDARFEKTQAGVATVSFRAENDLTFWNVTFTSGSMPANLYTLYNRTLRVFTIPMYSYWAIQPSNVSNNNIVSSFTASYTPGSGYVFIVQGGNPDSDPWVDTWLIKAKSTYKISAALPSQVVAGLPLTLDVTAPLSPSWCNVTFYNPAENRVYTNNVTVPSTSFQLTLKLNDTGTNRLVLFDRWTGGNEASFNNTLTVTVLPTACNLTFLARTSPVIGNTAMLKFRFYNNSLGMGSTVINRPLDTVTVNVTLPSSFAYDTTSGNLTVYMSTSSSEWRTGNNTVFVFAKSGVFNYTKQTWVMVQSALCNVTVTGYTSPVIGNIVALNFTFINKTIGVPPAQRYINPDLVLINGTSATHSYAAGVVTVTWSTATGEWHAGNNYVNVTAVKGIFVNGTVYQIYVIPPFCSVVVDEVHAPILGNIASVEFRFLNNTAGGAPINPGSVKINGTDKPFTYLGGVVTVTWNTTTGGWRAGPNHFNVSAVNGLFSNFSVTSVSIIQPLATLVLNATSYSAIYRDTVQVGLKFLNVTDSGSSSPLPELSALYLNGTLITCSKVGEWYVYGLSIATSRFPSEGGYHLNFTARYGNFYLAVNVTSITVSRIPMGLSIQLGQTRVTAGSALSVSANLTYSSGAAVEDGTSIIFRFTVTYADNSTQIFDEAASTSNGVATYGFPTTANMTRISVEARYGGDVTHASDSDLSSETVLVVQPEGLPVMLLIASVAGGSVLVILPLVVRARRRTGKVKEARKVSRLTEAASLAQLVVVHIASGRNVYSKSLGAEESVDPQLISGFLSANQAVLGEAFKKRAGATLKSADYGDYKVISHVGRYVMSTLFCTETAGKELQTTLQGFTKKFEDKFANVLVNWDGNMDAFKDAEEIAAEAFALSLVCPYMIDEEKASTAKLSGLETKLLRLATRLSVERGGVFFLPRIIDYLLTREKVKRSKASDILSEIGKKGIFKQLTFEEAENVVEHQTATDETA